jgi:hypothetical protein
MRNLMGFIRSGIILAFTCGVVHAGHVMVDTIIDGLKIELHVLQAEPFFTQDEVTAGKATEGMLIISGEKPLALDAGTHPNHHLVIHVFDANTGKAGTNANVKMSFQHLDSTGKALGNPIKVPVVKMQAIGKGEQSTHYGNNVVMPDGSYIVSLSVNKKKVSLPINLTTSSDDSMEGMQMH